MLDGNDVFRMLSEMDEEKRSQIVFPTYYNEDNVENAFECMGDDVAEAGFPYDCCAADIFTADEMKEMLMESVQRSSELRFGVAEGVTNELFDVLKEKIAEKAQHKED